MGFLDALSKPAKPMLGLDISSSAVKLIELSQSADRYKVESYRVMPLPANTVVEKNIADIQALADTLERLVARSGTKLTDTAVAVSGSSVITKEIELPAGLSDLQMETQIEVEADQYIPYPMEEVSFDFDVIGPVDNNPDLVRVLLAACRQENVEHRREALEMAGLIPKVVDERTNTIILTDTEEKINEFRRLITEIDVPIKQVLIEARIVIANTDFKKELGVTWGLAGIDRLSGGQFSSATGDRSLGFSGRRSGLTPGAGVVETFTYQADEVDTAGPDGQVGTPDDTVVVTQNYDFGLGDSLAVDLGVSDPTGSFSLGYLTDSFLIDLELSALESDGYGEIVSQPKVLTGDKQQAVIKSGTEIAFQKATSSGATSVEFKEAVLQLEVTPQITPDNRIMMDLLVSQDSVGAFTPTGEPSIDITQIETQALVGDGQTLVLGGIFQTEEVNGTENVPMLGDTPFLGKLFRNDLRNIEKREILMFITPKIIDDNLLDR